MKLCIRGQLVDVITLCQFFSQSVQGLKSSDTPKLPFPVDLLRRPYISVRTYRAHCDTMNNVPRRHGGHNVFNIMLPSYRSSNLREREHPFHLPHYDTVLFKKSFIARFLYKFVTTN